MPSLSGDGIFCLRPNNWRGGNCHAGRTICEQVVLEGFLKPLNVNKFSCRQEMWFRNHKPLGSRKCLCAKTFCWGAEFSWCNKNCPYVRTIGRSGALNCVSDHTKSLKVGDFLGDRTVVSAAQNSRKGGITSRGYCQCVLTLFTLARGFSTRTEFKLDCWGPATIFARAKNCSARDIRQVAICCPPRAPVVPSGRQLSWCHDILGIGDSQIALDIPASGCFARVGNCPRAQTICFRQQNLRAGKFVPAPKS